MYKPTGKPRCIYCASTMSLTFTRHHDANKEKVGSFLYKIATYW